MLAFCDVKRKRLPCKLSRRHELHVQSVHMCSRSALALPEQEAGGNLMSREGGEAYITGKSVV